MIVLNVPEKPDEIVAWIERMLCSNDIGRLVAQLQAVHGEPERAVKLDDLLQGKTQEVMQRGLAALPPPAIQNLLQQPRLLLDLQEFAFNEGSPYWDKLIAEGQCETDFVSLTQEVLRNELGASPETTVEPRPRAPMRGMAVYAAALALTAAAVIAIYIGVTGDDVPEEPSHQITWGWLSEDAFPRDVSAAVYLNTLANGGEEWSAQRPKTRAAVEQRLREFRDGCDQLLAASHQPLAPEDRDLLVQRCKRISGKLDAYLHDLTFPDNDPLVIRGYVDELIKQFVDRLREHAKDVA